MTRSDDEALVRGLLRGDGRVVELLRLWIRATFGPYKPRLAGELEDLEQDILLDLTRAFRERRFHRQSSVRTYVRTYVHHKCIDRLRAQSRRKWLDVEELGLPSEEPSPLEHLSKAEATKLALRVVEETPESCRELWRMLEQGMGYREMSDRLGVTVGALRVRVLRCRRRALEIRARLLGSDE